MAVDPGLLIAQYEAEAAVNTAALSDFATLYPHIVVGYQYEDSNGLMWEITAVYASKGYPVVLKSWVGADGVTNYTNMVLNFAGVPEPA